MAGILDALTSLFGGSPTQSAQMPTAQADVPEGVKTLFGMTPDDLRQRVRAIGAGMATESGDTDDKWAAMGRGFGGAQKYFGDQEALTRKEEMLRQRQAREDEQWNQEMELKRAVAERQGRLDDARIKQLEAGGGDELGLNLVYGKDENGNTVGFQVSKGGGLKPVELPPGVKLTPGTATVDLGTEIGIRDTRTGVIVDRLPKDVSGAAEQTQLGKSRAEANQQLGGARQIASHVAQQIDSLKNDPDLSSVVGPIDGRTPNILPGSVRAQSKVDQVQASAFLQGYQMLKGGGAITEVEGLKAERAMARLNQAQSEEDFKAALDEFNDAVQAGVRKLEAAAGVGISDSGEGVSGQGAKTGRTKSGVSWSIED